MLSATLGSLLGSLNLSHPLGFVVCALVPVNIGYMMAIVHTNELKQR